MSKSVLGVACGALTTGEAVLAPYGSRYSRRDYTQPPLFALLVRRWRESGSMQAPVLALMLRWSAQGAELSRRLGRRPAR
jgi:hypothetical protein